MDTRAAELKTRSKLYSAQARAVLRVEDYERARSFYHDTLGLPVDDLPGVPGSGIAIAGDGTQIELYQRPGIPAPENTVLAFHAVDFEATLEDLRRRGVVFEDYDIPEIGLKTEGGVAQMAAKKAAWFKDSEGNILSVSTM